MVVGVRIWVWWFGRYLGLRVTSRAEVKSKGEVGRCTREGGCTRDSGCAYLCMVVR